MKLASAGPAVGWFLALVLTRSMESFLYGVQAQDLVTFPTVPGLVVLVTCLACLAPAWKAARIEPLRALRQQ